MDARVRNANVLLFRFILPSIVCWLPVQCQTTNIVQRFCQLKEYPYVSLVYTFAACMCALCLCFPPSTWTPNFMFRFLYFFVFRRACCLFWNENKFHVLLSLLFFFRIKKNNIHKTIPPKIFYAEFKLFTCSRIHTLFHLSSIKTKWHKRK